MKNEILIFGHKNPDTDTICSAMVKEILNKKNGCEYHKQMESNNEKARNQNFFC